MMAFGFNIKDILQYELNLTVGIGNDSLRFIFVHPHLMLHARHLHHKIRIGKRLEHIIECTDFISLDRILGQGGHEDQQHIGIQGTQLSCDLHAVHVWHLNVHKDDLVFCPVGIEEQYGVGKHAHTSRNPFVRAPAGKVGFQQLSINRFVFNDCSTQHTLSPPVFTLPIL